MLWLLPWNYHEIAIIAAMIVAMIAAMGKRGDINDYGHDRAERGDINSDGHGHDRAK